MSDNGEDQKLTLFIEKGAEFSGQLAGPVVGSLLAGFPGMILGAAVGVAWQHSFKMVGHEVQKRILGKREEIRSAVAFTSALAKVHERLLHGDQLRDDEFFGAEGGYRSTAEEILEGVLLISQKEYEEIKVDFLGFMAANIMFDRTIDRSYANYLLKTCEALSYRQLCLLEFFGDPGKYGFVEEISNGKVTLGDRNPVFNMVHSIDTRLVFEDKDYLYGIKEDVVAEMRSLEQRGLLEIPKMSETRMISKLTSMGEKFKGLLELNRLRSDHIDRVASDVWMKDLR